MEPRSNPRFLDRRAGLETRRIDPAWNPQRAGENRPSFALRTAIDEAIRVKTPRIGSFTRLARDLPYRLNGSAKAEPSYRAGEASIARRFRPAFPPVLGETIMGRHVFDLLIPPVSRGVLHGSLIAAATIALVFTLDYVVGLLFQAHRSASRYLERSRSTRPIAPKPRLRPCRLDDPDAFEILFTKSNFADRPGRRVVADQYRTRRPALRVADLSFDRPR